MRKKSHINLATHIIRMPEMNHIAKHKKAFYVGSILPDCVPSFITRRHEITGTIEILEKKLGGLFESYKPATGGSSLYYTKLGEVLHYTADYFTFPHNNEYPGSMKDHCIYEGELKHKLRAYLKNLSEKDMHHWRRSVNLMDMERFKSARDIIEFIKEEHAKYIRRGIHSVEEDCKYIVGICSKVAVAIMHLCETSFIPARLIHNSL